MAKRPSPARSPSRPSPAKRTAKARAPRSSDARDLGFGEAPQAAFEGEPVAFDPMSISSWAGDIAHEAEAEKIAREADEVSGVRNEVEDEAERLARDGKAKAPAKGRVRSETGSTRAKRAGGGSKTSDGDLKTGRTSRGTSMSPTGASPSERAAAGFQPIAGMDIDIDEAERLLAQAHGQAAPPTSRKLDRGKAQSDRIMSKDKVVTREVDLDAKAGTSVAEGGVTATVQALQDLIATGNPLHQKQWVPHRPARPAKSEGGVPFKIVSDFEPAGDQPTAIAELVDGLRQNERMQTLLGVTGSGKTYTMAKVIEETQRPALILAPNKTLAAQLYGEMKNFFPDNAVEYFVSYYDYYQPEAYVPRSDTYIEKESTINEQIDRMRHSATRALLERDDVIIVASVSCIYGIGSVETYTAMTFGIEVGDRIDQRQLLADLVAQQYKRNDINFVRGSFRVRGDTIEIFPAHLEDSAWRISLFGDEVEQITEFDPLTGQKTDDLKSVKDLRQLALRHAAPDAQQGHQRHQGRAQGAAGRARIRRAPPRSAAAGAAHALRSGDAGGDRLVPGHRELLALPDRPPPRRPAADSVRVRARQRHRVHRRVPRHRQPDRRHVSRRLPPQGDAGRVRLPPALLHGQPPASLRGVGRDAARDGGGFGNTCGLGT